MNVWPPPLLLHPDHLPWAVDATGMGVTPDALDALPWAAALDEVAAMERGDVVNTDEGRQVGHWWLRAPERAPTLELAQAIDATASDVRAFAADVRAGRLRGDAGQAWTDVLLVGIGGSELGPHLLIDALAEDALGRARGLSLHFLDNTDPDGVARALGRLGARLASSLVVVISKSGSTPEPNNALALVRAAMVAAKLDAPRHLVAVTMEGSALDAVATREGWLRRFPMWDWVGGRYSVTSAVGLLPAELAGIDTTELLAGARAMDDWTRQPSWRSNPAALLAGCWHVAGEGRGRRAMVALPYCDRLVLLSKYLQQLVMESVGKERDRAGRVVHTGLTVYGNKGSTDQHAYVQQLRDGPDDFFVTFVQVLGTEAPDPTLADGFRAGDHLQGFLLGTRRALAESGKRSMTLTIPAVTPFVLGGLIALFERSVGLYAGLLGINAYHQPGVEAGKRAAKDLLGLGLRLADTLAEGPATVAELTAKLGASDPTETLYLLARLRALGRARCAGGSVDGRWSIV